MLRPMADLLVTDRLHRGSWGPARRLLRTVGPVELDRASDVFALVPIGRSGDWPAVAAVCSPCCDVTPELLALATRPDRRGEGLGTRLLDGVADSLRTVGHERLVASDQGDDGTAWLLARGFRRAGAGAVELLL